MRILTQLLLLATAIVLGAALAAATGPRPMLRALVVDLTGGMGPCARSPTCRKVMDIPVRLAPLPERGPFKPAPANMDQA
jgi:hypothetical protein